MSAKDILSPITALFTKPDVPKYKAPDVPNPDVVASELAEKARLRRGRASLITTGDTGLMGYGGGVRKTLLGE